MPAPSKCGTYFVDENACQSTASLESIMSKVDNQNQEGAGVIDTRRSILHVIISAYMMIIKVISSIGDVGA